MRPFGKPVEVKEGEILIKLETKDLNRSLEQAILAQKIHQQRVEIGSASALQLEIEQKELQSLGILAQEKKVSPFELNKKQNFDETIGDSIAK